MFLLFSSLSNLRLRDDLLRASHNGGRARRLGEHSLSGGGDLSNESSEFGVSALNKVPLFDELEDQFSDSSELNVLLFGDGQLARKEFDLLRQLSELFFKEGLFSQGDVQLRLKLGSLDGLFVQSVFEFTDSLSEQSVVLFAFSQLLLDQFDDLLEFFVVTLQLEQLNVELLDFDSQLVDGGVSVLNGSFQLLDSLGQVFDLLE